MKEFALDSKTLLKIRAEAEFLGKEVPGTSSSWERAYLALADAADRLEAMMARSTSRKVISEDEIAESQDV